MITFCKCLDLFFLILALLASMIGLVTNYWIAHDNTHHQGLWFYCNDEEVGCLHFDKDPDIIAAGGVPDWHYAVFGLYLIGVVFQLFCMIGFFFVLCRNRNTPCYYFHNITNIIGWLSLLTGMSLYTYMFSKRMDVNGYEWGYSFGMGWLSVIIHFITIIVSLSLTMLDHRRNDPYIQSFN